MFYCFFVILASILNAISFQSRSDYSGRIKGTLFFSSSSLLFSFLGYHLAPMSSICIELGRITDELYMILDHLGDLSLTSGRVGRWLAVGLVGSRMYF